MVRSFGWVATSAIAVGSEKNKPNKSRTFSLDGTALHTAFVQGHGDMQKMHENANRTGINWQQLQAANLSTPNLLFLYSGKYLIGTPSEWEMLNTMLVGSPVALLLSPSCERCLLVDLLSEHGVSTLWIRVGDTYPFHAPTGIGPKQAAG